MKTRSTVRTIEVGGRTFLHPSEAPGYDPTTGTYRGVRPKQLDEPEDRKDANPDQTDREQKPDS